MQDALDVYIQHDTFISVHWLSRRSHKQLVSASNSLPGAPGVAESHQFFVGKAGAGQGNCILFALPKSNVEAEHQSARRWIPQSGANLHLPMFHVCALVKLEMLL